MFNNDDNYPPGAANDPNAPYNQPEPEVVEVEVTAVATLTAGATVHSTDVMISRGTDYDIDDETGQAYPIGYEDKDYSNCNLEQDFNEEHYSPIELIEELKKYLDKDIQDCEDIGFDKGITNVDYQTLKYLREACDMWTQVDLEVERDE